MYLEDYFAPALASFSLLAFIAGVISYHVCNHPGAPAYHEIVNAGSFVSIVEDQSHVRHAYFYVDGKPVRIALIKGVTPGL